MNKEYLKRAYFLYVEYCKHAHCEPIYKPESVYNKEFFKEYINSAIKDLRIKKLNNILKDE